MKLTPEEKKRLAIAELWSRADLSFKFHAAQHKINALYKKARGKLVVLNCSRQLGKSFFAVCKSIEVALSKPKAQVRYAAAFQSDLLDYIIPAFHTIMEDCPESIKGVYNTQQTAFIFPNGSKIKLVGLDKRPNGLRGNSLDAVVIDEAAFCNKLEYIYDSIILPATLHRPKAKVLFISTPPNTPDHPFSMFCEKAELEESYAVFTIYDNPMIDEQTILKLQKEVGGKESTNWLREFECKFVTDANSAIFPEWKDDYIKDIPKDEFYSFYHTYTSMDLGVKHFTAAIFGYYNFKMASLIVEDEIHLNGPTLTTPIIVENIKAIENRLWGDLKPYKRISDNNNLQLINDMGIMHGMHFVATNKDTLEAMINEVRIMLIQGRILIHPRCKQLIGCLQNGIWDSKKKHFAMSVKFGHYDHAAALIYLVRNLDEITNPIPSTLGLNHQTHWMKNLQNKQNVSQSAANLAAAFERKY